MRPLRTRVEFELAGRSKPAAPDRGSAREESAQRGGEPQGAGEETACQPTGPGQREGPRETENLVWVATLEKTNPSVKGPFKRFKKPAVRR